MDLDLKGLPTKQSSTSSGGIAERAVDGNTETKYGGNSCTHTGSDKDAWWRVDLQSDALVKTVTVWNRGDCCGGRLNGFVVKVGDAEDPKKNTVCGGKNQISQGKHGAVECAGKEGRYVFIQLTKKDHLTICEVKVLAWQGVLRMITEPNGRQDYHMSRQLFCTAL